MKKWIVCFACLFPFTRLLADQGVFYAPQEPYSCWIFGELLYWKVFEGGMEYADSFDIDIGDLAHAHAHNIDFDYKPGYRVGAGLLTPCCLDFNINYTFLSSSHRDSATGTLFPTFNYFGSAEGELADPSASAEANWHVRFQTAELEMGRLFSPLPAFELHPHIGVQGAWIDQKGGVNYTGGVPPINPYTITFKNDFWGVGLKGGLDASLQMGGGFSVFSDLALSLLYGHFDIRQTQIQIGVPQIDLSQTFRRLSPALQAAVGLTWEPCFRNYKIPFILSAAMEWQYWWDQNQTERFTSGTFPIHLVPEYDLGLFGLTLRGTFYY
jgi:hypothetical protein